jgi:cytochrome c
MKRLACILAVLLFVLVLAATGFSADGAALYAKCAGCHGADGTKKALGTGLPLKGLSAADVSKALSGYRAKSFGGEKKAIMESQAQALSPEDIEALAAYISKL